MVANTSKRAVISIKPTIKTIDRDPIKSKQVIDATSKSISRSALEERFDDIIDRFVVYEHFVMAPSYDNSREGIIKSTCESVTLNALRNALEEVKEKHNLNNMTNFAFIDEEVSAMNAFDAIYNNIHDKFATYDETRKTL